MPPGSPLAIRGLGSGSGFAGTSENRPRPYWETDTSAFAEACCRTDPNRSPASPVRTVRLTSEQLSRFAEASGDCNPLHIDEGFAWRTPYGRPIAHGALVATAA